MGSLTTQSPESERGLSPRRFSSKNRRFEGVCHLVAPEAQRKGWRDPSVTRTPPLCNRRGGLRDEPVGANPCVCPGMEGNIAPLRLPHVTEMAGDFKSEKQEGLIRFSFIIFVKKYSAMTTIKVFVKSKRDAGLLIRLLRKVSFVEQIEEIEKSDLSINQVAAVKSYLDKNSSASFFSDIVDPVSWQKNLRDEWK